MHVAGRRMLELWYLHMPRAAALEDPRATSGKESSFSREKNVASDFSLCFFSLRVTWVHFLTHTHTPLWSPVCDRVVHRAHLTGLL